MDKEFDFDFVDACEYPVQAGSSSDAESEQAMTPFQLKAQQVKQRFDQQGIPVSQWADQHGFRRSDVYRVLNGFSACKRGLQHEIAVKLGLKPDPSKTLA